MKLTTIFAVVAIVMLSISCAPKQEKAAEAAPAASAAVAPSEIKDPAAWVAAYEAAIAEYTTVASKLNAGDPSQMKRSEELVKTAADLDASGETIKATLADKALADFTAKAKELKEKFANAAAG